VLLISVIFVGPYFIHAQLSNTNDTKTSQKIGIKITSPKTNQTVPLGQLTIYGTSSDTPETNCLVYVDWNDAKPMQNVTGIGSGGLNDYSNWTFTYTQKYYLIAEGNNELTSKISCYTNSGISNMTTKYYSINVTGSSNPTSFTVPTTSDNRGFDNSTTRAISPGYHSVLPQYSNILSNDSSNVKDNASDIRVPKSSTYIEIRSGYSDDSKKADNKKDNEKIEIHAMSSLMSSKLEKMKDGRNNLNIKWYKGEPTHQDLNKYIHNLIKEKLDRISDKLTD
jgi:hypothetical protein